MESSLALACYLSDCFYILVPLPSFGIDVKVEQIKAKEQKMHMQQLQLMRQAQMQRIKGS